MKSVFVSHPGLQHSHQLAMALHELGLLQAFWSGVPVISPGETLPFWLPGKFARRIKVVDIPPELRRHPPIFQILLRTGAFLPKSLAGDEYSHRIFHFYDWWVSRQIRQLKPDVVVGYENSSYHTFLAAKTIGARCVLDAASLHHSVGTRSKVNQPTLFRAEINRRKDLEVELADLIITCSPLAAESYRNVGVPEKKLKSVLLGAELPKTPSIWQPHERPLRFIFVGALRYLKSIDVILKVFRRFHTEKLFAQVLFVGSMAEPVWLEEIRKIPNANYHPSVPQTQLFQMYREADCLLLPSRFDSFGMVVAEAMACGTPAIVSTQAGAKAMIEQFPGSGWIVEPEEDSLYHCIRERIENRGELFAARQHALEVGRYFTWQAYRERVGQVIQEFIVQ